MANYEIFHLEEVKLLQIREKSLLVENELWQNKRYYLPISCLEYGVEPHYENSVNQIVEVSVCEWWLIQNQII